MKWFKHDTDANSDNRLQNVLLDYGLEGYGLYWYCLELIGGNVDKDKFNFELEHDARVIARNTGSTPQKVEEMMKYFINIGLFENAEGIVTCLKMAKRLDKSMTSNPEMRKVIEGFNSNNTQLDGYVYFIEKRTPSGEVVAIKIGRSKNPTSRISELSKIEENIGFVLEMLHKIKSDNCVQLETDYHRRFKHLKIYNEWFTPHNDIYIEIKSAYDMITTSDVMQEENRIDKNRINTLSIGIDDNCESEKKKQSSLYDKKQIIDTWNQKADKHGLPRIRVITDTTAKRLKKFYDKYKRCQKELGKEARDATDIICRFIEAYEPSPYALGQNPSNKKHGIEIAFVDWFVDQELAKE